ncbi:hypothetical protein [Nocardiopsis oceani]
MRTPLTAAIGTIAGAALAASLLFAPSAAAEDAIYPNPDYYGLPHSCKGFSEVDRSYVCIWLNDLPNGRLVQGTVHAAGTNEIKDATVYLVPENEIGEHKPLRTWSGQDGIYTAWQPLPKTNERIQIRATYLSPDGRWLQMAGSGYL